MPGIMGIIRKANTEKNKIDLQLMIDTMAHESFYNSGTYSDDHSGFYAGWVCHQDSFSDCMPVWNEKKNIVLVFFGENFTDFDLFDHLKAKHHRFDRDNASYIIHLYEEKGIDFLKDLNGWFSGILLDTNEDRIILFNDRYGLQRIFYYENQDGFYFASEAKALLKVCPETRVIDPKGFGEFLSCNCVLENRTLYNKVFLLPGASVWISEHGKIIKKSKYFDQESLENQSWLEKDYFCERLRQTFSKILPRYLRTRQKIGISLTGGLDTRGILANAEMPKGKYPCYTFGGMYRDCYDVKVARKVAEACNQPHQTLYLDNDFLSNFPEYAEKTIYITDGYCGVSSSYELYLNKLAREIAPIRITGNYGGELLRGIEGTIKAGAFDERFYHPDIKPFFLQSRETLNDLYASVSHPMSFNILNEIPWFRNHGFVIEQSQLTPRTPYLDNDLVQLAYRIPMDARKNLEVSLRLIGDGNSILGEIPSDRGFGGKRKFITSYVIELYLEFLFKAEYAYNYGMPQWLAAIDNKLSFMNLEKLFLGRHKFTHFRIWYRDELSEYIKSILLDERTLSRPYLNRNFLDKMVKLHTNGSRNYSNEISKVLSIELIHRLLLEKI